MAKLFSIITFIFVNLLYIKGQRYHEYGIIESCSGSAGSNEILFTGDDEVAGYMELDDKKLVTTLPDFVPASFVNHYFPLADIDPSAGITPLCKEGFFRTFSLNAPEPEPPWSSIYPKKDVKLNVNNTLICLVSGFFPPPVRISWTKNKVNVTDSATLSRYYPNKDKTLNVFSRLSFIPEEGDIYSCSVEHKALQQPLTRIWEVEIKGYNIGPAVFCGVGLGLGLLGLTTGTYFILNGKNHN